MAGVNLDRARAKVAEKTMLDRCRITLDSEGAGDDVLDEATLALVAPSGDAGTLWEGQCEVAAVTQVATHRGRAIPAAGPRPPDGVTYQASLPATAPAIPSGAILEVTAATYDPSLVGSRFVVDSSVSETLLVSRTLWLREV